MKASKSKIKDIGKWLPGQNKYTLHKAVRKLFPRNPSKVSNTDDVWDMDVAMSRLKNTWIISSTNFNAQFNNNMYVTLKTSNYIMPNKQNRFTNIRTPR